MLFLSKNVNLGVAKWNRMKNRTGENVLAKREQRLSQSEPSLKWVGVTANVRKLCGGRAKVLQQAMQTCYGLGDYYDNEGTVCRECDAKIQNYKAKCKIFPINNS